MRSVAHVGSKCFSVATGAQGAMHYLCESLLQGGYKEVQRPSKISFLTKCKSRLGSERGPCRHCLSFCSSTFVWSYLILSLLSDQFIRNDLNFLRRLLQLSKAIRLQLFLGFGAVQEMLLPLLETNSISDRDPKTLRVQRQDGSFSCTYKADRTRVDKPWPSSKSRL